MLGKRESFLLLRFGLSRPALRVLLAVAALLACAGVLHAQERTSRNDASLRERLARHPDADANGDGVLTATEAQAFARKLRAREAAERAIRMIESRPKEPPIAAEQTENVRHPMRQGELPPAELLKKWREMLQSPDPATRMTAVKDMWRARHKDTAAMLLDMVSDPNEEVSREAMLLVEMNQKLHIPVPFEPILRLLSSEVAFRRAHGARLTASHPQPERFLEAMLAAERDPHDSVREWAYRFFAKTRIAEGKPVLIRAVTKDPKPLNRAIAAGALYYYGSEEACPALIEASADDSHLVRRNALHALISCGDGQALPLLLKLAKSTEPEDRRHALNTIGWAKWISADLRDKVLIEAIEDPEVSVRAWVYELIGRQEVRRANDALRARLLSGKDIDQESLFFGLSRIADARSGEALLSFMEKHGQIGKLALEGVATSGNASLISQLTEFMEKQTNDKRRNEIGRAITVILEKNPHLAYEDQELADSAKKLVVATAPKARVQRIMLYRRDWSVVDVEFRNGHGRGERWLLREVAGEWKVLSRHGTWIE